MGIDEHAKDSALQLAALGYYTFVADIYGVGKNLPIIKKQVKVRVIIKNNS